MASRASHPPSSSSTELPSSGGSLSLCDREEKTSHAEPLTVEGGGSRGERRWGSLHISREAEAGDGRLCWDRVAHAAHTSSDKQRAKFGLLPAARGERLRAEPHFTDGETEACAVDGFVLGVGDRKTWQEDRALGCL